MTHHSWGKGKERIAETYKLEREDMQALEHSSAHRNQTSLAALLLG